MRKFVLSFSVVFVLGLVGCGGFDEIFFDIQVEIEV